MVLGVAPGNEHVVVLDDILLDENAIAHPFPADPVENAITHLNGREGNVQLVNAKQLPKITVHNGTPQRLRIVKVSNTRFMRLSFSEEHTLWRVGGDGGLLGEPLTVGPIGQSPPTMAVVIMGDNRAGRRDHVRRRSHERRHAHAGRTNRPHLAPRGEHQGRAVLEWHDWPRGDHDAVYAPDRSISPTHDPTDGMAPPASLATFRLVGQPSPHAGTYAPPSRLRIIDPVPTALSQALENRPSRETWRSCQTGKP